MEKRKTLSVLTMRDIIHAMGAGILVLGVAMPASAVIEATPTSTTPVPEHQAYMPEEDDILKALAPAEKQ